MDNGNYFEGYEDWSARRNQPQLENHQTPDLEAQGDVSGTRLRKAALAVLVPLSVFVAARTFPHAIPSFVGKVLAGAQIAGTAGHRLLSFAGSVVVPRMAAAAQAAGVAGQAVVNYGSSVVVPNVLAAAQAAGVAGKALVSYGSSVVQTAGKAAHTLLNYSRSVMVPNVFTATRSFGAGLKDLWTSTSSIAMSKVYGIARTVGDARYMFSPQIVPMLGTGAVITTTVCVIGAGTYAALSSPLGQNLAAKLSPWAPTDQAVNAGMARFEQLSGEEAQYMLSKLYDIATSGGSLAQSSPRQGHSSSLTRGEDLVGPVGVNTGDSGFSLDTAILLKALPILREKAAAYRPGEARYYDSEYFAQIINGLEQHERAAITRYVASMGVFKRAILGTQGYHRILSAASAEARLELSGQKLTQATWSLAIGGSVTQLARMSVDNAIHMINSLGMTAQMNDALLYKPSIDGESIVLKRQDGFHAELFGDVVILLRALPALLDKVDSRPEQAGLYSSEYLSSIIDWLAAIEETTMNEYFYGDDQDCVGEEWYRNLLMSAVAGARLKIEERQQMTEHAHENWSV